MARVPLFGTGGREFRRSQAARTGPWPSVWHLQCLSDRPGRIPLEQRRGQAAGGHTSPGVPRGPRARRSAPQASPIPGARGRPRGSRARLAATRVPGVCFPRASREPAHPVPPYLAFSSASTARRSTVLKRLFMARVRVATAVLPAADPTHGRLASAHACLARLYGSPDDPLFLEAKVRHVTGTLGSSMISSVLFCFVFFPLY